ncbi:hypothetical protein [Sphingomonas sp. CARO-RG-8B-R24-01]|uniref:CC_3452 family protein n=1 Tax=Sphingomonas sp. CARO-RG-8B-R24-01 TaxID=2914831 RepID=UPI001F5A56A7|nr:hypothetical protein [Sphingomonas sp. CARO-RG-8B-R24-01]
MSSTFRAAAPFLATALLLTPVVGHAADAGRYYVATPAAAPAQQMLITSGTVWKWRDTAFTASKGPQRENIMCEMIVQHAGKLSAFSAGGKVFDDAALTKCNAHAK